MLRQGYTYQFFLLKISYLLPLFLFQILCVPKVDALKCYESLTEAALVYHQ